MSDIVDPKLLNYRKKGARIRLKDIQALEARIAALEEQVEKLSKAKKAPAKKAAAKSE